MDVASDANPQRNWVQWRSTMEDRVPDPEDEAVENLLQPRAEITEFSDLMGQRNINGEQSIAENSGSMPDSTDDETCMRSEERGVTEGKQATV